MFTLLFGIASNDTKQRLDSVAEACDFEDVEDIVECPAQLLALGWDVAVDSAEAFAAFVTETIALAADVVLDAYLAAWIDDIDAGLEHWSELGLATTKALFDAQAYRNTQFDECKFEGAEDGQNRINCEEAIGALDVLLHEADPFINQYLLSMLGAPDFVGGLRQILQDVSDALDVLGIPFNPIEESLAALTELAKEYVKDVVREAFGVDIDQLKSFLTSPTHWLNVQSVTLTLPGAGAVSLNLFEPDTHERLDMLMGLAADHHVPVNIPGIGPSSRLSDTATFNPETFAPLRNTVTTAKLLLLDGGELNRAVGDLLADQGIVQSADKVQTYPDPAGIPTNVMFHPLSGSEPWLQSIDSDHAWRQDGLPRFCDTGSPLCAAFPGLDPTPREELHNGGNGEFPLWESCLLRPAFRGLYQDWESGAQQFPDLGDAPAADPSDSNPPVSTLTPSANIFVSNGITYLGKDHLLTLTAQDQVFQAAKLGLEYRFYKDGAAPGAFQALPNGGTFQIPVDAGDGTWHVDYRAEDPCHTFDPADTLAPEATQTATFVLDTTPPVVAYTSPAQGQVFDTDDFSQIAYSADDGPLGSGVASTSVTLDGQAATNGQVLDMFFLYPGTRTLAVTATDNLGNSGVTTRTFEVHATAESLLNNVDRAWSLGLITDPKVYQGLRDKAVAANKAHGRGQHPTEWNIWSAFIDQLLAQRGQGIDAATADRFTAYARDLIALGR